MVRSFTQDAAMSWSSVQFLPQGALKLVLNAAVDTLPHNANLHLLRKRDYDRCPLCSTDKQNLVHVLNSCKTALELRRYNTRHNAVLRKIFEVVKETILTTTKISVDLDGDYRFCNHITSTDIVCWEDSTKLVTILTIP